MLRYDNGQGLVFRRTISVDDHYMFTIADQVENKSGQPVTLRPWGQVAQLTEPKTLGYSVLHEGLIAVFGDGRAEGVYTFVLRSRISTRQRKTPRTRITGQRRLGWVSPIQYWATVLVPEQSTPYEAGCSVTSISSFTPNYLAGAGNGCSGQQRSR